MKFAFIDAITELTPGERIVTVKAVTLAEDYFADHFPTFPVLPGVLMLQAMVESAGWLVRHTLDFAPIVILLREARNVTYKSFVRPGQLLRLEVTCRRLSESDSDFSGIGYCDRMEVVKGRFSLRHVSVTDQERQGRSTADRIVKEARARFALLLRRRDGVPCAVVDAPSQDSLT